MERWDVRFAKILKNPNQKSMQIGVVIGRVEQAPELVISTDNGQVILDKEQLILSSWIEHMHYHDSDQFHTPVPITLQVGDQVILMPTPNQQVYVLLDKVGG